MESETNRSMCANLDRLKEKLGPIQDIVEPYDRKKGFLIPFLHQIQEEHGFLPSEMLQKLAVTLGLPLSEIYGVASFYHQFHFSPRGRVVVRVCMGTACHVRGASIVLNALKAHYGIGVGETTEDLSMTLETVGCVGCCGLAPVATINDQVAGEVGSHDIIDLVSRVEEAA